MLKEACATAALAAATLLPSTSQVQAGTAACVSIAAGVSESRAAPCKGMTGDSGRKCLYCKGKRGGWKRQYREKKENKPKLRECDMAPGPANPKKVCTICKEDARWCRGIVRRHLRNVRPRPGPRGGGRGRAS